YTNNKTHVNITCKVCGNAIRRRPDTHLRGAGCSKCQVKRQSQLQTKSKEQVLSEFIEVHKDTYNYDMSTYINATSKMEITCKKHGVFKQTPSSHLLGSGCRKCGTERTMTVLTKTTGEFIFQAKERHGDRYDYSDTVYVKDASEVNIRCIEHDIKFKQTPNKHLAIRPNSGGCPECARLAKGADKLLGEEYFVSNAVRIHGDKYDYSDLHYTSMSGSKVHIKCNSCNNVFTTNASNHLWRESGCPRCSKSGYDQTKPGILYYLSINNGQAYKIGVTNRSVDLRFSPSDLKNITTLKTWEYQDGYVAFAEEQRILKEFKYAKYQGDALLVSGNTELFNQDILQLDNHKWNKDNQ
ncbi:MAG: hypothetical protein U9Q40_05920, partial [Campylobacterota bacterium]|nr:hypothetical protein [Campylobacterota bacterium]